MACKARLTSESGRWSSASASAERSPLEVWDSAPGKLVVLDLGRIRLQGLALLLAVGVDVGVRQDPVEPSLEIGAGLVLMEGCERLGERLLDEILGVSGVSRRA